MSSHRETRAAALPEACYTVYRNVIDRAGLKPGERLLVHGGSSGIGAEWAHRTMTASLTVRWMSFTRPPISLVARLERSASFLTSSATTGIMELLSPAELEGVMAHELAHVRHRDVVIMTIASFFASIASLILQFGFFFGGSDDVGEVGGHDERQHLEVVLLRTARVAPGDNELLEALGQWHGRGIRGNVAAHVAHGALPVIAAECR